VTSLNLPTQTVNPVQIFESNTVIRFLSLFSVSQEKIRGWIIIPGEIAWL